MKSITGTDVSAAKVNLSGEDVSGNEMSSPSNKRSLKPGTRIRTEDGYTLTVQSDGSISDGDITFENLADLAENVAFTVIGEDGKPVAVDEAESNSGLANE